MAIKKDTQPKKTVTRKSLRERLRDGVEVSCMSGTCLEVLYKCPKTFQSFNLPEFGDTDIFTMEQLEAMKNSYKSYLEKYWIIPVEVISGDVTLEEVLQHLGLDRNYKGLKINETIIDDIIFKTSTKAFEEKMSKVNIQFVLRVAERMKVLYEQGEFSNKYKMSIIEKTLEKDNIFEEE